MTPDPRAMIRLKAVRLRAVIGTESHEREAPRDLLADISFEYDASLAAATDALGCAVDYAAMHRDIAGAVAGTRFLLLERLAAFILEIVMRDPKVLAASIILEKPAVLEGVGGVAIGMSAQKAGDAGSVSGRCA